MNSYFAFERLFRQNKAKLSKPIPQIHEMIALVTMPSEWVKPATTKVRQDTVATVKA